MHLVYSFKQKQISETQINVILLLSLSNKKAKKDTTNSKTKASISLFYDLCQNILRNHHLKSCHKSH